MSVTPSRIADALSDLLFDPSTPLPAVLDRYFSPDYRQRTDGVWSTREEFADHIVHLRSLVAGGQVAVHEELHDGAVFAERHTVELTKTDGGRVRSEVYVFGRLAPDGRFEQIEETTLLLAGTDADRNLGSAR